MVNKTLLLCVVDAPASLGRDKISMNVFYELQMYSTLCLPKTPMQTEVPIHVLAAGTIVMCIKHICGPK